jgi:hypothetical protein
MREINNREDILDSRDIIARIEELNEEREDLAEEVTNAEEELENVEEAEGDTAAASNALDAARIALDEWNGSEAEELASLEAFAANLEGYGDWEHGETLIRASYFTEYAEQMAEDIGAIDPNANWPLNHIDWDAAAEDLKIDYTESDFDGVTYYMRA